jgi:hypothetical protein
MEALQVIFNQLDVNKVTCNIDVNGYEEGVGLIAAAVDMEPIVPIRMSTWVPPLVSTDSSPQSMASATCSVRTSATTITDASTTSVCFPKESNMTKLMLWKNPLLSLLEDDRMQEESYKFKAELLMMLDHFDNRVCKKLDMNKDAVRATIKEDKVDEQLVKFLANYWNVVFMTEDYVHGNVSSATECYFFKYETHAISYIQPASLEESRKKSILKFLSTKKLNSIKDIKELFKRIQLPVTKVCPETGKNKPILKPELHDVIVGYLSSTR